MSTIPHTGPPCLASDDDEDLPVRCTRDKGHDGDHEADDGEQVVARWAPARFTPEIVEWARNTLTSAVSGTRNDESAPTDAATSTGASPTPSNARSKTMSSITEAPAWATTSTVLEGDPDELVPTFTTHSRLIATMTGRDDSIATATVGQDEVRVLIEQTEGADTAEGGLPHVLIEVVGRHGLCLDVAQARALTAALTEAATILEAVKA